MSRAERRQRLRINTALIVLAVALAVLAISPWRSHLMDAVDWVWDEAVDVWEGITG